MGICVGIDLVSEQDVAAAIEAHGDRYLDRVYTPREQADCTRTDGSVSEERLAARFAVKEAVLKALGCPEPRVLTDIETVRAADGAPTVHLSGEPARRAASQGIGALAVSLTHEAGMAAAVVCGERG